MKLGSKLDPGNVPVLRLLSRDDVSQEVGPGEEPTTMEDVEDVEDRKVDRLRSGLLGFASCRLRGKVDSHGDTSGAVGASERVGEETQACFCRGRETIVVVDMVVKKKEDVTHWRLLMHHTFVALVILPARQKAEVPGS